MTDNLTLLVWLRNANAFGARIWTDASSDCATLSTGEYGLTDGSTDGDWRLPSVQELLTLLDYRYYDPALCNTTGTGQWTSGNPFTNVRSLGYWSRTLSPIGTTAWTLDMYQGVTPDTGANTLARSACASNAASITAAKAAYAPFWSGGKTVRYAICTGSNSAPPSGFRGSSEQRYTTSSSEARARGTTSGATDEPAQPAAREVLTPSGARQVLDAGVETP